MTFQEYKEEVQSRFPIKFEETLTYDQDHNAVDKILYSAVRQTLVSLERIESITIVSNVTQIPNALSVLKCVPSASNSGTYNVFQMLKYKDRRIQSIPWYFDPSIRTLKLDINYNLEGYQVTAEFVVDPATLDVTYLTNEYITLAVELGAALLGIKEGGLGALVTLIPNTLTYKTYYNYR